MISRKRRSKEELSIITREAPGIAEIENFEEIKAFPAARLDACRDLACSEDSLKQSKADKTALNKLKKAPDTRRKEIKALYMEPTLFVFLRSGAPCEVRIIRGSCRV